MYYKNVARARTWRHVIKTATVQSSLVQQQKHVASESPLLTDALATKKERRPTLSVSIEREEDREFL